MSNKQKGGGGGAKGGGGGGKKGGAAQLNTIPPPDFVAARNATFDELWKAQQEQYAAQSKDIKVTLPNKKQVDAKSWVTTPQDIASGIAKSLGTNCIVAKVDDQLWDVGRPLEADCNIEILTWEDSEARKVFWHSSAHVLGYALERALGTRLSIGPPLDPGFFYEGLPADEGGKPVTISEEKYGLIEAGMEELVKANSPYQRLVCPKNAALEMFKYNPFKYEILKSKVPEGGHCTVYKCGNLVDPCRGPHVLSTGKVKAFAVTKNSSAYWQGKADQQALQRVYGVAFPDKKLLAEYIEVMKQAAERDHRRLGREQQLWFFDERSPGCCFYHPPGARIYNGLIEFMRKQYRKQGFEEVVTPNMFHNKLWQTSGHWGFYAENMFKVEIEKEMHALKPMNCPSHMVIYGQTSRSYRDLPLRFADFGVLHRNELSGSLTGLTRVRRFQQDDAHIFCRHDQMENEVKQALDFMASVYSVFGLKFELALSTRQPKKMIGDEALWDWAENALAAAMLKWCNIPEEFPHPFEDGVTVKYDGTEKAIKLLKKSVSVKKAEQPRLYWELNPEDAAFYGPKIDIQVQDSMLRRHQCATIQLDFNLPERFKLSYVMSSEEKQKKEEEWKLKHPDQQEIPADAIGVDGVKANARPVVIHRAILGSVERCLAILAEHWGGRWPFWISPRQVMIVPVSHENDDYAREVKDHLWSAGFYSEADLGDGTMNNKVRAAWANHWSMTFVVGAQEATNKSVNIRVGQSKIGEMSLEEAANWMQMLCDTHAPEINAPQKEGDTPAPKEEDKQKAPAQ